MKDDEYYKDYNRNFKDSEKSLQELSELIDMASAMQGEILKKKKEIRKIILILATVVYFAVMMLFVIKFYAMTIIDFDKFLLIFILTLSFTSGLSVFSLYRIKYTVSELKIDRYAMQELMEVIFNLRKIVKRLPSNVVDITILDIKLKRLKFY